MKWPRPIGGGAAARWLALALLAQLLCGFDPFRSQNDAIEQGNAKLAEGRTKEALAAYERAAKALPGEPGVHYNRGVALYKLGKHAEARKALSRATGATDPELKAKAFYNMGNAQFQLKQYRDAADAYRRALRLRPNHRPSKWNLELALRRIEQEEKKKKEQEDKKKKKEQEDKKKKKEQEDKKKKQQQDKQDKQQQDKQDKQQQDKQDKQQQDKQDKQQQDKQDKQQQDKQDQQKQDKQDQPKQQQQPKQQPGAKRPPPPQRQLDRTLDALDKSDKNLQRRRLRLLYGGRRRPPDKDW